MNKIVALFISAIALFSCHPKEHQKYAPTSASYVDSLNYRLNKIHEQGYINGFAVAIVNDREVLYEAGIGYADLKSHKEYTTTTIQNIGSVSKTFIGIALLKAQEMGKLNLDDPINQYLPFEVFHPDYPETHITLRHLATHTSTILDSDYYNEKAYVLKEDIAVPDSIVAMTETFNPPSTAIPLIEFLEKILSSQGEWYDKQKFLNKRPGELYEYSNVGSTLAAAVLELATGMTYNDFATQYVLEPLAMSQSSWQFDEIDMALHTKLYARPDIELPYYSLITYPDGGLKTNISDMAKYLVELIIGYGGQGKVLQPESYRELFTEQLEARHIPDQDPNGDPYDDEYNTGIFMGFSPKGYIGHTGGDPGIATFMFFDPERKTGKILMINTSVRGSDGVKEFYDIWYTLDEYEKILNEQSVEN